MSRFPNNFIFNYPRIGFLWQPQTMLIRRYCCVCVQSNHMCCDWKSRTTQSINESIRAWPLFRSLLHWAIVLNFFSFLGNCPPKIPRSQPPTFLSPRVYFLGWLILKDAFEGRVFSELRGWSVSLIFLRTISFMVSF